MMSREMVLELLASAGDDLMVDTLSDGDVEVVVQDFDGFDDDWSEIDRELDDPDLVDDLYDQLSAAALSASGDYYRYFDFGDFVVVWGYASFDI